MRVEVRLFASLRDHLPAGASDNVVVVTLSERATVDELVRALRLPTDDVRVIMVNGRARPLDWALGPGDRVGIFPAIGGG